MLADHRVQLSVVAIALITWINLRDVRESGTMFAFPTYFFLIIFGRLIVAGLIMDQTETLDPAASQSVSAPAAVPAIGWLLIVRAFSSGCTALTGVEAISNGNPAFRQPEADNPGILC